MNRIYTVSHPDHDVDLTVIAPSPEEACELGADYCDEEEEMAGEYTAVESPVAGLRWVGFESADDAREQIRELDARGVSAVQYRVTSYAGGDYLWEVGCEDADWCRLAAGVLCGGDQ